MVKRVAYPLPAMKARGWGRVIQIASSAGLRPIPSMGNYATTKTANVMFTVSLAQELNRQALIC